MPRLPGISQKEAVRVFQKLGFRVVRESGHLIMSNGERRLVIPRHDPINAITMGAIARDAGLTPAIPRSALNAWPGAIWCCGRWSSIRQAYLLAEPELDLSLIHI